MRFKGTLVLFVICLGVGAFVYFYEIKGGEQRAKAKEAENVVWKFPVEDVQQLDLTTAGQRITGVRAGERQWQITAPRTLDADADEWNRLASSAADISREDVVEENAASLAPFGLDPPQTALAIKTKDGKVREIRFGSNEPAGNSTYAALQGTNRVFTVSSSVAANFNKKLDDLRNRAILSFEQFETQSLALQSAKGKIELAKEGDRWWFQGKDRFPADSSGVNGVLGDLANGRVKEFLDDSPEAYAGLGFDKPAVDVRVIVGKDKAIKHLQIGLEKSKLVKKGQPPPKPGVKGEAKKEDSAAPVLFVARDESRPGLFFVEKEFVDKLLKSPPDLRDKALAAFQRYDVDAIEVTGAKGTVTLTKAQSGDWQVGSAKKKARFDAVNDIFDSLEKQVKEFVDAPGALSAYGLDKPVAHVILKQGGTVKADCIFGKEAKGGVYAQVMGEPFVKIAEKESLDKLAKAEADYIEPPPPPTPPAEKKEPGVRSQESE
jgi:hypothetical protein